MNNCGIETIRDNCGIEPIRDNCGIETFLTFLLLGPVRGYQLQQ